MHYFKFNKISKSKNSEKFDFYYYNIIKYPNGGGRASYERKDAKWLNIILFGVHIQFIKAEIKIPTISFVKVDKYFRDDLRKWQSEYSFCGVPFFYKYQIAVYPTQKVKTEIRLFKKSKKTEKIFKPFDLPLPRVGRQEFKEIYNSIKWIVPINKVLDLKLP